MVNENANLTKLDLVQAEKRTIDALNDSYRVTVVGSDMGQVIADSISGALKDIKFEANTSQQKNTVEYIKVPELIREVQAISVPEIVKETAVVYVPQVLKEIEYREIEKTVIVTEYKTIEVPVIIKEIVEIEKHANPASQDTPMLLTILLIAQTATSIILSIMHLIMHK